MKSLVRIALVLFLAIGGFLNPVSADDEIIFGEENIPKPWPQYACNAAHTSNSFDTWDYETYHDVAWELKLKTNRGWNRNPVIGNGMMVIGDTYYVRCIDVISGSQMWSLELSEACTESCTILGDTVIVPLQSRYLALSMATGEIVWYASSGDSHMSSVAALLKNEEIYGYFSSYSQTGAVHRVRLDTPKSGWRIGHERAVVAAPGVNDVASTVGMAGHYDLKLLAEGYGGIKESYEISTQFWAPTVAFDKYMIYTAAGGEIIALPKPAGASSEEIIDVGSWCFHGPSVYGDSLVIGNDRGRLVRFKINGDIIWDVDMPGKVTDALTVMDDKLLVPVASSDAEIAGVYIVSPDTGEIIDKVLFGEEAEYVYQPVVAWKRMFVEFGSNEKYRTRTVFCYGKQPRPKDQEPKLLIKDKSFNVSIPWRGETTRQVRLSNEGKVDLELLFDGGSLMEPTVEVLPLPAGEETTIRVKIKAGNNRPGNYSGQLEIFIMDGEYGHRTLGFVTANITVTEEEPEEPQPEPPNPPTDLTAVWVYDHVELNWKKSEEGAETVGYNVFKSIGQDTPLPNTEMNKSMVKETNLKDSDVEPGKTYNYAVVAIAKDQLYSDMSDPVSITIPLKLKAVTNLKAEKKDGDIILTWESEQDVEFKIECNGEETGKTSEKTYTHENPPRTQLIYKVFPLNGDEIGPEAFVIFENKPDKVNPVTNLRYEMIGDSVMLIWDHDDNATYEISRNDEFLEETTEKYYKDNSAPKQKLAYSITAKIGGVESEATQIVVNLAPPIVEITELKTDVAENSIMLYWQGKQEGTHYIILRNGVEIAKVKDTYYIDSEFVRNGLNKYEVYPERDGEKGKSLTVKADLRPEKTVVVFTIGKATAKVNGIEMDCKGTPFVSSAGRSMVPFRFLGESIGAEVGYTTGEDGGVETVSYIMGGKIIILTIGSKIADVDGKMVELDAGPMIREGRTYVPLRFVTEALGAEVGWDSLTRSATITISQP